MKYGIHALIITAFASPAHADDIPDFRDSVEKRTLHLELARPESYPVYLYKAKGESSSRVGRFLLNGKVPTGPVQCEHLKIVRKRDEAPIAWDARDTAASNVYYHVHKAVDYFAGLSVAAGVTIYDERKPITIRLDMDVDWAMWIKFSEQPHYNHAQTFPDADPDKWGTPDEEREIWFHIPKRLPMPWYVPGRYLPGLKDTIFGTVGFPCDTARVPTIIYHEWTHLMTRPYLGIEKATVLNEGYSDYFGSVIWGRPKMGDTEEFATFPYQRDYSKDPARLEAKQLTEPSDFIPRFFWSLRRRYGARADVLAWKALTRLSKASTIKDLPAAVLAAAPDSGFGVKEVDELRARMTRLFTPVPGRKGS